MKWFFVGIYIASLLFVHFRGKARLPFMRQLFDHSTLMAPLNSFMYLFSKVPTTPYLASDAFDDLDVLEQNWETIRDEAQALAEANKIQAARQNNDAGFNSFFKVGWKRFYLKWYDAQHPSAEKMCPKTVALLSQIKCVKAAMFAELPPGGKLNVHRDPYAGSLRYHLGLITPNDDRCYIDVNHQRKSWRDGVGFVFDETYLHTASNNTDQNRIILFCDLARPMRYRWAQAVNDWLGRHLMRAAASPNETGDEVGGISKLFQWVWVAGQYRRRLKAFSKPLYLCVKSGLIAGVVLSVIYL
jgi:beta-hydroxylase